VKIYVLTDGAYSDEEIRAVFNSKATAEAWEKRLREKKTYTYVYEFNLNDTESLVEELERSWKEMEG
jgi:hypothetical protein